MNENFMAFASFFGFGDQLSKIWFVGIEEGGTAVTQDNLDEQLARIRNGSSFFDNAEANTDVWNIIADIMWDGIREHCAIPFQEYRLKMFTRVYSHFFLSELFPLPRPNTDSWPEEYFDIFEYGSEDYFRYLSDVRSFRFPQIYNLWNSIAKPEITVCFGGTVMDEFTHLFKLGHSHFDSYCNGKIFFFPEEKVLITPFFNRRTLNKCERQKIKDLVRPVTSYLVIM